MKCNKTTIAFLACIFLIQIGCKGQDSKNNEVTQKLESFLTKIEEQGFHGSVLVAMDGKKLLSQGYGFANDQQQVENHYNTVFDIGSITKQFTAAAILKLEMQGKLSVNDKINKYLNGIPEDKSDITIHELLTHSSGLPSAIGDDYEVTTDDEFVKQAMESPIRFRDKTKYNYSNVGYSLLTLIIQEVSGMSYEEFLYHQLWKPANMQNTGYLRPGFKSKSVAVGYRNDEAWGRPNEQKWDVDGPYLHLKGNGGILSTTEDMYKWHLALLSDQILSKKAKEKYYKPHVEEGEGSSSYYGYGWAIFDTPRKTKLIAHNGGNGIFFADFWRYFTEDLTIIVMTNRADRFSERLASQLAMIVLKPDYEPKSPEEYSIQASDGEKAEMLMEALFSAINSSDEKVWEEFILNNAAQEFIEYVPMKKHLEYFKNFHNDLKDGEIVGVDFTNEGIEFVVQSGTQMFQVNIGTVTIKDGSLKMEGLRMN